MKTIQHPAAVQTQNIASQNQISAFKYLCDVIKFRFTRSKWLNKTFVIYGRKRKIIGEDCYNVIFDGGINTPVPKDYLKTLQKKQITKADCKVLKMEV